MKNKHLFLTLLLAFLLSACSFSLAQDVTPPPGYQPQTPVVTQAPMSGPVYPVVAPDPNSGESLFPEKCAPCHGPTGQGDGERAANLPNPVPALASPAVARQSTPAEWYIMVTQGNLDRFMPPFASLSDHERWGVVAYAYTLGFTQESLSQGKQLYQANCAQCHGEDGRGDGPQAASLDVKPPDFTDQAFMSERSAQDFFNAMTEGVPPVMPAFNQLSESERWALADHLRAISFAPIDKQMAAETLGPQDTPQPGEATQESPVAASETISDTMETGAISGMVTNASNGMPATDLTVTLQGFDNMTMAVTRTAQTTENGSFMFNDVDMPEGRAFRALVDYSGTTYSSNFAMVEAGMPALLDLPIEVYETTTDTSSLVGDRVHLFFDLVDDQNLRVIELFIISNSSDKNVVAAEEGQPVLNYTLPPGAANLEFQNGTLGGRFVQTADGFGDLASVPPGQGSYQVLFAYTLPYEGKLDLSQPLPVPVDAVVVLAPEDSIKVRGEGLQDEGVQDVEGVSYHMYNMGRQEAGDQLTLTVSGRGSSSILPSFSLGDSSSLVVGLAAFGVVLIVAGIWLYSRSRVTVDDAPEATEENAETVMDAILALDDLYKSGELPEEAYLKRRAELKERLQELLG